MLQAFLIFIRFAHRYLLQVAIMFLCFSIEQISRAIEARLYSSGACYMLSLICAYVPGQWNKLLPPPLPCL